MERERAVKSALDHHYDLWYADWRRSQQTAIEQAVNAERQRHRREVSAGRGHDGSSVRGLPVGGHDAFGGGHTDTLHSRSSSVRDV